MLSGNRNFEGRINPLVKANYLASPPLVVAYALAGSTDIDLTTEPLGKDKRGKPRFSEGHLADAAAEIAGRGRGQGAAGDVPPRYDNVWDSQSSSGTKSKPAKAIFSTGMPDSTYIQEPPFLIDLAPKPAPIEPINGARVLAALGRFGHDRPYFAGRFDRGQEPGRAISAGAWRLAAGFQQLRLAPRQRSGDDPRHVCQHPHPQSLAPGTEGGVTRHLPDGQ